MKELREGRERKLFHSSFLIYINKCIKISSNRQNLLVMLFLSPAARRVRSSAGERVGVACHAQGLAASVLHDVVGNLFQVVLTEHEDKCYP